MEDKRMPRPGDIYNYHKEKPYQIITIATHTNTNEQLIIYQALYGDFKIYASPLHAFIIEMDHTDAVANYRFEPGKTEDISLNNKDKMNLQHISQQVVKKIDDVEVDFNKQEDSIENNHEDGKVNILLLKFLEAETYTKKLEVLTSNRKHLNDRLINDMSVALDCTIDDGPIDERIEGLINCLQAMCRFENKRLR